MIIKNIDDINEFNMIDICKFILAIAVVSSHTNAFINVDSIVVNDVAAYLQGISIMFFYIVIGFFVVYKSDRKLNDGCDSINKQINKLIKMYIVWTVISTPIIIYGYIISQESFIHSVLSYIKYFFFVGKLYNAYHLYFLLASIIALIVMKIILKNNCGMGIFFVIAYTMYVVNGSIMSLSKSDIDILKNIGDVYKYIFNNGSIFTGAVYVAIGALIAESGKFLNKWGCLIGLVVINIFGDSGWLHILKPMFFFMIVLDIRLPNKKLWKKLREMSTLIYSSHLVIYSVYTIVILSEPNKFGLGSFFVTFLFSCLFALIMLNLKNKVVGIRKIFF